jgi:hypothetical protein
MFRQTGMYPGKGIIIGTVNRLQFNKWQTNCPIGKWVWQLIAIFGKINQFQVPGAWFRVLIKDFLYYR